MTARTKRILLDLLAFIAFAAMFLAGWFIMP
jgi:hypothetical protein